MRSLEEINHARRVVCRALLTPQLAVQQKVVLQGMSVALQWAAGADGFSLQQLIDGLPIQTEKPPTAAQQTEPP